MVNEDSIKNFNYVNDYVFRIQNNVLRLRLLFFIENNVVRLRLRFLIFEKRITFTFTFFILKIT